MKLFFHIALELLNIVELLLFIYFAMSSLYVLIFAAGGHFYSNRKMKTVSNQNRIGVFIPAYKEDEVIVDVAKKALTQKYASNNFDVIIIADSLQIKTIQELKKLPIKLVEVSFKNSTKTKALNKAMSEIDEKYDYVLILDADNIMEDRFLIKLNMAFENGFKAVQGHRKAKNLNTTFATLDAASEEINNHIFRKGHRVFGLSSGLIGSGMGFEYELFKKIMSPINAVGGFDKELEFELAKSKISIEYLHDAIVLDEKIQKPQDFSIQRRRWLATQFIYLKKYFVQGCKQLLFNQNINLFDKAWQLLIPPRLLLIGMIFIMASIYSFLEFGLNISMGVSAIFWLSILLMIVSAFLLSLSKSFYNLNTLRAMIGIPNAFLRMILLLFRLKGANKKYIHTPHNILNN